MSNVAIRVENLGKQYHIGGPKKKYVSRQDQFNDVLMAPFRRARKLLRGQATGAAELDETIWSLKDVSFVVKPGEVVGIIGRNGAGKSTLLKILSRITEPTTGGADIYGRVGSLLEVGTGFHPELTGRENVYLNGAILGMKKAEIDRKFDEIVAFSEIEKFIDTPAKHYSSGMSVRLAFAVAAHLELEILMIDEVLAVGDMRFQKKCLNKMEDASQLGRTVLFVSHNMSTVTRLCERVILLDEGELIEDGSPHQVVGTYLDAGLGTTSAREWPDPAQAPGGEIVRLDAVRVVGENEEAADAVDIRHLIKVEMVYEVLRPGYVLLPRYDFFNQDGVEVFNLLDQDPAWRKRMRPTGRYVSRVKIPGNVLTEGTLYVTPGMMSLNPNVVQFQERDAIAFQVIDSIDGDTARGDWGGRMKGVIRPLLTWETQYRQDGLSEPVK